MIGKKSKEYYVSVSDDVMAPEETLLDGGSEFSNIEQPIPPSVFRLSFWIIAGLVAVIFAATGKISIADHQQYADLSSQNRSANFSLPPPRGIVFDASGAPLVKNVPSFDLIAVSKEIRAGLKSNTLDVNRLAGILKLAAADLMAQLTSESQNANIFFVAEDLTKDQILAIEYADPGGLYVVPDVKRVYVDGIKLSQIVGYAGKVNREDLGQDPYYRATDTIGRLGIESEYENELRGEHGRIFFGDSAGTLNTEAITGNNIVLNIDHDLQAKTYDTMRAVLAEAGLSRGAAIIQNPQTGVVLALVSFPSFDNNLFSKGLTQAEYKAVFDNPARPLFNRVISGLYNPGSTIKPFMGLMALQEKIVSPSTAIQDCVSITINNPFQAGVSYTFKNWRPELGSFNLRKAIANSCNIYFFAVGGGLDRITGLGIERIAKYLKNAFADKILGIDLTGETAGFVPTPEWKEAERNEGWYQGDTYNTSIGQGDLLVTPLWLNAYVSAVANGGTVYKPQVANRVIDHQKNPIKVFEPEALGPLGFSEDVLKEIKNDMEETIISGTAQLLRDLPVRAGAKTGTAEVVKGRSINSLFTVFAPLDRPEIAMTVLVEGSAANQGYAIRTAHQVLQWYFGQRASQ